MKFERELVEKELAVQANDTKQVKLALAGLKRSDWAWMAENWHNKDEQVFTHICRDSGETIHVRVQALQKALREDATLGQPTMINLPEDLYQHIIESQGIERDHLERISPDKAVYEPALILCLPGGEHIIVDGNHKLVKSYELGLRKHTAILLSRESVEPYLAKPPANVVALLQAATHANLQLCDVISMAAQGAL